MARDGARVEAIITVALTFLVFAGALGALAVFVDAATSGSFSVTVTVSNTAPTISWVNSSFALTPQENTTGVYQFRFNATDANGAADLADGTATVIIALGGQTATSTACTPADSGNTAAYNCSVEIPYYFDASAAWTINASVEDIGGAYAENTTQTFTLNELRAIQLTLASISFSGSPSDDDVLASEGPQRVRNTGNYDFTQLNLTAFDLEGAGANVLGAGNFSVNVTASGGAGQSLVNATPVVIADADLTHGQDANETLYIYLDIPATVADDTFSSAANWVVDAS